MVWRVIGAQFGVLPDGIPAPVHFLESGEAVDLAAGGVEDIAAVEQVRIGPGRPGMNNTSFHVDEVGVAPNAKERVAGSRFRLVPVKHLGGTLQPLVGEQGG